MEVSKCWKITELPKDSLKMKNCKTRYKAQTASRLKEVIEPPPTHSHQINPHNVVGIKIFLRRYTEIYRHLLSKCFKNVALGRQEMVQCKCFFWHQTETCAGKFAKSEMFSAVLSEHISFNVFQCQVSGGS